MVGAMAVIGGAVFAGSASACSYPGAEQKFSSWGDQHFYVLAPDGGFENEAAGWTLSGGASTVAGSESFFLNSKTDSKSLALPAGSSAVSPPLCMSFETPVLRTLVRNTGDPSSRLKVELTYALGRNVRTATYTTFTAGSSWAPSPELSTVGTLAPLIGIVVPSSINVRLTPMDNKGNWQVDDFFVDPFARH